MQYLDMNGKMYFIVVIMSHCAGMKNYSPEMLMAFSQGIYVLSLHSHPETLGWPLTWVELNIFSFHTLKFFSLVE